MKTITKPIYLIVTFDKYDNEPRLLVSDSDFSLSDGYTAIASKEISFDVPSNEVVTAACVGGLEAVRATMRAAAASAITEVDNQLASLLAIKHEQAEIDSLDSIELTEVKL